MSVESATQSPVQLGRPLGTGRDWRRRLVLHHLPLALASGIALFLFMAYSPDSPPPQMDMTAGGALPQEAAPMDHGDGQASGMAMGGGRGLMARYTTSTGYVATGLLALTLLVGPANLLLRRRNPVSTSLARDTGTWATVFSAVHVIFGFQVHGNAGDIFNFRLYFLSGDGIPKINSFGLGNWTGLAALVIVAGLLALSNDRSLRELKARRWKNLQRLNYALFALVVLHAFFYGALLRMTSLFTLVLIFIVIAVLAGQAVGFWLWRRRGLSHGSQQERQPAGSPR
jgi:sulfoxide reductase heme-binding subunit YedZ